MMHGSGSAGKYFNEILSDTFGKENIVAAHLHRDEETLHILVTLVPINAEKEKSRQKSDTAKSLPTP